MTTPAIPAPDAAAAPAATAATTLTAPPAAPVPPAAVATPPSGEAAAAGAPEATKAPYEFALPEGFEAGAALEKFKAEAVKHKLAPEAAQAFLSMHAAVLKEQNEAQAAEIASWAKSLPTDKVIGGPQYEANKQHIIKAATRFANADPEIKAWLEAGMGNHPLMARILFGVGKAMGEDSVAGLSGGAPQAKPADPLRERYPSMFKES